MASATQQTQRTDRDEELRRVQLHRVRRRATRQEAFVTVSELRRMTQSRSSDQRMLALMLMQNQMSRGALRKAYFSMAKDLIEDVNNNCRWQAMIAIEYFMYDEPEKVWEIVEQYGQHADEDMRTAVATVLLEHLLDDQSRKFRARTVKLAARSALFKDTLSRCWSFDDRKMVEECLHEAAGA